MSYWKQQTPVARRMFICFGLLTLWTVAGPGFAVFVLQQGTFQKWPPENQVEWVSLILATGGFFVLLITTLWTAWKNQQISQSMLDEKLQLDRRKRAEQ
ncbi:MAG: hypothetical protein RJA81_1033 [Planctomycetota bacterium]|jgi:hypothetical protein